MKFRCKRSDLAGLAVLVGQAVPSKSTKKVFECLRIAAGPNGLELSGTDLEVAVRYRLPEAEVSEPGEAVVPAALFSGILREVADETVSVSSGKQKLSLETDGGFFEIEGEDPQQFPEIPSFPAAATGSLAAEDLRALVRKTAFAAGKEAARFVLNGVKLFAGEDSLRFVATDGRRLATAARPLERKDGEGKPLAAVVGVKGLQHFEKLAGEAGGSVEVAISDRHVALRGGNGEVLSRVMDGVFPDYEQIVPKESKGTASLPVGVLGSRLRQVGQFASVESQSVVLLSFGAGELKIFAAGGDGRAEVSMGIEYEGPEVRIGFNPSFLLDALKAVDGETVSCGLNGGNAAGRFSDEAGFLYVLMPVMID